jgi:hypothetical protein
MYIFLTIVFMSEIGFSTEYPFRSESCLQVVLSYPRNRLYASFPELDTIISVNKDTMTECPNENITNILAPTYFMIDSSGNNMYVSCALWPNEQIMRINMNDLNQRDSISLNGRIQQFYFREDQNLLYVVHRTYPIPGQSAGRYDAVKNYPDSGFISVINLSNFSLIGTHIIGALPMGIWYSGYNDTIYVPTDIEVMDFSKQEYIEGYGVKIVDSTTYEELEFITGGNHAFGDHPVFIANWTDNSRYFVLPNINMAQQPFSLRVIDGLDNSVALDLSFTNPINSNPMCVDYCAKVLGINTIWALSNTIYAFDEPMYRHLIKINTDTHDYEIYEFEGAFKGTNWFDFTLDGRTLYLPQNDGSILVTSPGNHSPACFLQILTRMPYQGPSPAAIEFDTSGTFDEDGDQLTYSWDFDGDCIFDEPVDDSYTGDSDNPIHEYTQSGEYTVNLMVSDNYQGECETSVIVSVKII